MMTAKEFLSELRWLDKRIEDRLEEAARLRSQINRATSIMTDMPRGGKGSDWTDTLLRACQLEAKIKAEVDRLIRWKSDARAAIDAVEDGRYRRLLEMRYIDRRSWQAIAREMHYDVSWVYVLHGRALRDVVVPEERVE